MNTYEIEVKSLLGSEERAGALRETLVAKGATKTGENSQLNHYFLPGDFSQLKESLAPYFNEEQNKKFGMILESGSDFSIRSREVDGVVKMVIKASMDATTSDNGIARMEFEENLPLSLSELDTILLDAGFTYQAKWSRMREEYSLDDISVTLDKNAGYGWLSEFELVVDDSTQLSEAEAKIRSLMESCGVEELSQERLARMFEHYNSNWNDYYGTDNIFTIE